MLKPDVSLPLALDIETVCGIGCETGCEHALEPPKNRVTVVAVSDGTDSRVFRDLVELAAWLSQPGIRLIGHNFKFDLHTLIFHFNKLGLTEIATKLPSMWYGDTLVYASCLLTKVPDDYIAAYEAARTELNKQRPSHSKSHRKASKHSLKVLAPFFLEVSPFWENPDNHDDDTYVMKDASYTAKLWHLFEEIASKGESGFYHEKLFPYTKLLFRMEQRGITVDIDQIHKEMEQATVKSQELKDKLDLLWKDAYAEYRGIKLKELRAEYDQKAQKAIEKAKDKEKAQARYDALYLSAAAKVPHTINLDSPNQLNWLLKEYRGLDISDFHGEESTGKPVLKRLAGQGQEDITTYLDYRQQRKLVTAFFPSYLDMQHQGVVHCTFNAHGTRTGRLSSSNPNLQQVPGSLHKLFIARPGYVLITRDESAIEPRLIAYYSNDLVLYDILKSGQDFHGYNTKIFFDLECPVEEIKAKYKLEREVGKEVGLALMYGAGRLRLQESAQKRGFVWSPKECEYKLSRFREAYEGVWKLRSVINESLQSGPITNFMGRPFSIPDPQDIHMKGLNTLIQSSASDIVLESAYIAQAEFDRQGVDAHVLLLVHDEIVVEAAQDQQDKAAQILEEAMTKHDLTSQLGAIKLLVEGKISRCWEK